jgi:NTP pyrophosphatase (non-canonical NTP hydrolase)
MRIKEFQRMMKRIYFRHDSARGVKGTYDWLIDEVDELGQELEGGNKEALQDEFADVLAWLASLANVAHIDLEAAALRKYPGKCPKCLQTPCKCPDRSDD